MSWALKASSAPGRGSGALGACLVLLFVSPREGAQQRRREEQAVARAILNVRVLAPRTVERVHDADVSTRAVRVCMHFGGSGRSADYHLPSLRSRPCRRTLSIHLHALWTVHLRAEVLGVGGLYRERDGHIYVAESMSYGSENWGTQRELMSRRCLRVGYGDQLRSARAPTRRSIRMV
ncbi:hypothetical protein B0H13DRAFT_2004376 [Mycena leptocephala]|nr:hypothetical protein B0H13DRAFT_2004376 [Mycena leptocephala]